MSMQPRIISAAVKAGIGGLVLGVALGVAFAPHKLQSQLEDSARQINGLLDEVRRLEERASHHRAEIDAAKDDAFDRGYTLGFEEGKAKLVSKE